MVELKGQIYNPKYAFGGKLKFSALIKAGLVEKQITIKLDKYAMRYILSSLGGSQIEEKNLYPQIDPSFMIKLLEGKKIILRIE